MSFVYYVVLLASVEEFARSVQIRYEVKEVNILPVWPLVSRTTVCKWDNLIRRKKKSRHFRGHPICSYPRQMYSEKSITVALKSWNHRIHDQSRRNHSTNMLADAYGTNTWSNLSSFVVRVSKTEHCFNQLFPTWRSIVCHSAWIYVSSHFNLASRVCHGFIILSMPSNFHIEYNPFWTLVVK